MKRTIIFIILIAIIGAGVYYLNQKEPQKENTQSIYTIEESREIAENWIKNESPTYTYDGENLMLKESRALDLVDCEDCYEFDFSFKSRHGGFGNREGEMVTQAITPHITTVTVEHGEVTKAITDNEFDEMTGKVKQGGQGVDRLQPREVDLYYYNKNKDIGEGGQAQCSPKAVQPISRVVKGENLIKDTIKLLLKGRIQPGEKQQGFSTEFPNENFSLKDTQLKNGTLTLTFTQVPGFTSGGSCRTRLLKTQIEKTAKQFPEVEDVVIKPETLFQP